MAPVKLFSRIDHKRHFPDCPVNCCCMGEDDMKNNLRDHPAFINLRQKYWDDIKTKLEPDWVVWPKTDLWKDLNKKSWATDAGIYARGPKGVTFEDVRKAADLLDGVAEVDAGRAIRDLQMKMFEAIGADEDEEEELLDTPEGINDYDCSIKRS